MLIRLFVFLLFVLVDVVADRYPPPLINTSMRRKTCTRTWLSILLMANWIRS